MPLLFRVVLSKAKGKENDLPQPAWTLHEVANIICELSGCNPPAEPCLVNSIVQGSSPRPSPIPLIDSKNCGSNTGGQA